MPDESPHANPYRTPHSDLVTNGDKWHNRTPIVGLAVMWSVLLFTAVPIMPSIREGPLLWIRLGATSLSIGALCILVPYASKPGAGSKVVAVPSIGLLLLTLFAMWINA